MNGESRCPRCGRPGIRRSRSFLARYIERLRGAMRFRCRKCGHAWTKQRVTYFVPGGTCGMSAPVPEPPLPDLDAPRAPSRPAVPDPNLQVATRAFDTVDRLIDLVAEMHESRADVERALIRATRDDKAAADRSEPLHPPDETPVNEVLRLKVKLLERELARARSRHA